MQDIGESKSNPAMAELLSDMIRIRARSVIRDDFWNPETIKSTDSIGKAMKMLVDNGYLAAPVIDAVSNQYVGIISMMDLTQRALELCEDVDEFYTWSVEWFWKQTRFTNTKVEAIMHRPPKREVHPNFSLFHAFENMARARQHRLAVLDHDTHEVKGILTQSMFIEWFHNNMTTEQQRAIPIKSLRPYQVVYTVDADETAIDAFEMMADEDITGVAIVEPATGELYDVLSTRDLRGIGAGTPRFKKLFDSVAKFKMNVKENFPEAPQWLQYVTLNATLADVLDKMDNRGVHRVFVCRSMNDLTPVDIITQTDVLSYFLNQMTAARRTRAMGSSGRSSKR